MSPLIERHRAELLALAAQYGVADLRVFGSMARGDDDADSDVDLPSDRYRERQRSTSAGC